MSGSPFTLADQVRAALASHGLLVRGILHPADPPQLTDGAPAASILLVGHAGSSLWPAFTEWQAKDEGGPDPLDRWSKAVIQPLAESFGATAWFPSDPPYQPFQRWAMEAEGLKASPLGILIHPQFGLWHGYRAALGFATRIENDLPSVAGPHPCDSCAEKPCLTTCPVGAVSPERFDVAACRAFLPVQADHLCLESGCLARAACPVGAAYRYDPAQLRFHMAALKL